MAEEVWDCIVVGAGIIGSWAGYHLAKRGSRTLILDQFMLPHTRGSSSGHSRIIRSLYKEECYVAMMPDTYRQWNQLEQDVGYKLFEPTTVLMVQHNDVLAPIEDNRVTMDKFSIPYKKLTPSELRQKYPQLVYSEEYRGLVDTTAGLLLSARCLNAVQEQFKKRGGVIRDGVKVEKIVPGSTVTLLTSKGSYRAKKVVLAAGPWAKDVLSGVGINAPLQTMPGLSVFFKEREPSDPQHSTDQGFPILYSYLYYKPGEYRFVCAFPSVEYPGMVKMVTRGEPPPYYCHPDDRDTRGSDDLVNILVKYVSKHLPHLDPKPAIMEPCVYTMTPNKDYIIDRHPVHSNIVIGAGFSGHGYKLAPVVGKLLTELVLGLTHSYDLSTFTLPSQKSKI